MTAAGRGDGGLKTGTFLPIVDVLRALSVVAVVAYHAGMPGIPGGYVGVDVFFVISGFLIIGQIVADNRRGTFSYAGFWARRALRILPTYLLVIVASTLVALYVLVMPDEFLEFGRQVAWSAGMVVNHLFLGEQGYFDTAAESKPLLHLWSLAVEEQFYLFAPLVLGVLCWLAGPRFGRTGRWIVAAIVAAMFVASLWLCVRYTGTEDGKNYAFYLMPLRAWEFILGGAVPYLLPWLSRWSRGALMLVMVAGFGLILGAVFGFSHDTAFPSWHAALPAVGAVLVIASGLAAPDTALVRTLAVRPVLWIGLISYAWYLWHWPLMAFSRIYNFGELPLAWGMGMALLSMLLAALSYAWIEKPVKEWRKRTRQKMGLKPIAAGVLACVAMVGMGQAMAVKLPQKARAEMPSGMVAGHGTNSRHCRLVGLASMAKCKAALKKENHQRLGVVIGDSHARAAFNELRKYGAKRHDASTITMIAMNCTPLQQVLLYRSQKGKVFPCHEEKHKAFALLQKGEVSPDYAVIYARWNATTPWMTERMTDGMQRRALGYMDGDGPHDDQHGIFVEKMEELIQSLHDVGVKRVLVIASTPEFFREVAPCSLRSDKYGIPRDRKCSVLLARVQGRREFSLPWLQESLAGKENVRLIDPAPVFCDSQLCRGYEDDKVLYRDDDHINDAGMRRIIDRYRQEFDWVMGG